MVEYFILQKSKNVSKYNPNIQNHNLRVGMEIGSLPDGSERFWLYAWVIPENIQETV